MPKAEPIQESITQEGLESLRAEIAELEGPGRGAMAERIKAARELGDLKENAEYHIAKEDQAHLETRILLLKERLRHAVVVEVDDSVGDVFAFGRSAEILDEMTGTARVWTLVGAAEADMANGRMSVEAPVGRALRDRSVGEVVAVETPGGKKTFRIEKLVD